MKDSIRCCISCILPCGALDVIRIVHASGRVEEIGGGRVVLADEIMRAHPKHVLRKPPSSSAFDHCGGGDRDGPRAAVVLPPNAELQRGSIYFLMPVRTADKERTNSRSRRRTRTRTNKESASESVSVSVSVSDRYLTEILSEKVSTQKERRRGRIGVWRPHLESISEIAND